MGIEERRVSEDGAEAELVELLRRMRPRFQKILAANRIPPEDAEDVVQDVLIQFVRKRTQIRSPEAWLAGALRNQCKMYWRGRDRRPAKRMDDALIELLVGGSHEDPEREVMRRSLRRWVAELPENCRSLLHKRYGLGLNVQETAKRTGYKPSSIDQTTRRCLKILRDKMAALAGRRSKRK